MTSMTFSDHRPHLPDPQTDPQFFTGVLPKRIVAWFIDAVLGFVGGLLLALILGIFTLGLGFLAAPLMIAGFGFAYRALSLIKWSATPGMIFLGLQYRDLGGLRLDRQTALVHSGIWMLTMAVMIGWFISMVTILGTRLNQGLPDLLAGTVLINRPID